MPWLSSNRYTCALFSDCADDQVSSAHCWPEFGHVPQRRLTVSFDDGGSIPSLMAATDSHDDVYDADAVAVRATFDDVGGGSVVPPPMAMSALLKLLNAGLTSDSPPPPSQ